MIEHLTHCAAQAVARKDCDCGAVERLAQRLVADHLANVGAPGPSSRRVTPDHVRAVLGAPA